MQKIKDLSFYCPKCNNFVEFEGALHYEDNFDKRIVITECFCGVILGKVVFEKRLKEPGKDELIKKGNKNGKNR